MLKINRRTLILKPYYSNIKCEALIREYDDKYFCKDQILENILSINDKFNDCYFKPVSNSLVPYNKENLIVKKTPSKYVKEYLTYVFKRPEAVFKKTNNELVPESGNSGSLLISNNINYCFFSKYSKLTSQDIIQGSLASCYLIVTLANMSIHSDRIEKIFLNTEINKQGAYGIKCYIQGELKEIVVDDFFPVKPESGKYAFSTTNKVDNEIWVQIIEKAWGKANQSCYLRTFLGTPQEAMYFLLPSPSIYISHRHKDNINNSNNSLFVYMYNALYFYKWVVCTNTEEIDSKGHSLDLIKFHAYAVLNLVVLKKKFHKTEFHIKNNNEHMITIEDINNSNYLKLIKLRNPWGDKSYTGKYNNLKELKNNYISLFNFNIEDQEIQNNVCSIFSDNNIKPGSFYMEFDEYIKYFPWSFYSKYNEDYVYNYIKYSINVEINQSDSIIDRTITSILSDNKLIKIGNNKEINSDIDESKKIEVEEESNNNNNILNNIIKFENKNNNKNDNNYSHPYLKKKFTYNNNYTTFKDLKNLKLKEEMLKNGDNKIFDIVNRNCACSFIRVTQKMKATITFHQPQKRFIKDVQDSFKIPFASVFLLKLQSYENNSVEDALISKNLKYLNEFQKYNSNKEYYTLIKANYINYEKVIIEHEFNELGEYHIICISQFENFDLSFSLIISIYSNIDCKLYYLKNNNLLYNWLLNVLINIAYENNCYCYFSKEEPSSYYMSLLNGEYNTTGFGLLYYENNSKDADLKVKVDINSIFGLKILNIQHNKIYYETLDEVTSFLLVKSKTYKAVLIQFVDHINKVILNLNQQLVFDYKPEAIVDKFLTEKNYTSLDTKVSKYNIDLNCSKFYCIRYISGYLFYIYNKSNSNIKFEITIKNMPWYFYIGYDSMIHDNNCNIDTKNFMNINEIREFNKVNYYNYIGYVTNSENIINSNLNNDSNNSNDIEEILDIKYVKNNQNSYNNNLSKILKERKSLKSYKSEFIIFPNNIRYLQIKCKNNLIRSYNINYDYNIKVL